MANYHQTDRSKPVYREEKSPHQTAYWRFKCNNQECQSVWLEEPVLKYVTLACPDCGHHDLTVTRVVGGPMFRARLLVVCAAIGIGIGWLLTTIGAGL